MDVSYCFGDKTNMCTYGILRYIWCLTRYLQALLKRVSSIYGWVAMVPNLCEYQVTTVKIMSA